MAEEGVLVSRELAELMREIGRKYKAHGWPTQSASQPRYYPEQSIIFVNRSGEEIPPYACMQVTGTIEEDGRTLFEVGKPNASTLVSENQLLFNGPRAVADNETGSAQQPTIVRAIKDTAETADNPGEGWTYTDGQWYLSPGGAFTYYGTSDIDDDVIVVKCPGGDSLRWFILAEDLSSTTDPEVYVWPGTMATGVTPTADTSGDPIALVNVGYCLSPSGKLARAGYYGTMANIGGRWIPISTYECLSSCTSSGGSITQPTFTDATVGVSYSFSIATSGTVTGLTISNLPAGLSASGNNITGTPTTAGHKWVRITGTSGDCTITKLAKLTVLEAA